MFVKSSFTENQDIESKVRLNEFDSSIGLDRGAGKVKETIWYLFKLMFFSAFPFPSAFKVYILRAFGAEIGQRVVIKPRVNILFPWKLVVGNDVWMGEEALLLNFEQLRIGNNVCISQRSFLCGGNHDFSIPSMPYRNGPIVLKDGSWVGACCFLGPGVTIGTDTVVVAGSVVTSNVDAGGIYKGSPAVFIKQRWKDKVE